MITNNSTLVDLVLVEDDDTRMIVDAGTPRERSVATYRLLFSVHGRGPSIASTRAHDMTEATEAIAAMLRDALREALR